ncbi:pentapeptide repeat-containing protein [Aldersonia sp. NBC_00410]|uniref:pentapeptide repeat-containing protein n=1 Tax=Aldersonia sp. NBC_00410 TaxID=2975954 RepID=UPI00225437D7|nr:pentapeptide repeat-containing protein [Aldersonia sp. NBC_00410]MCX5046232.1 pentapeptide repeat-containing protein [Aldersonia sp. NBC_00410]
MATTDLAELLPAEQRLLDAALAGERCDLIDPEAEPTPAEIAEWNDPDREIRAAFLAELITGGQRYAGPLIERVAVRGAIITGQLNVSGPADIVEIDLAYCKFGAVKVQKGVKFGGDASFVGSAFTEGVRFWGATFAGVTQFAYATFDEDVQFIKATFAGYAGFGLATFSGVAGFSGAKFAGDVQFQATTFNGVAEFMGAKFAGDVQFQATFNGVAEFGGATFNGFAQFMVATFAGNAEFGWATFNGFAGFGMATFAGNAGFGDATFNGVAGFGGATFNGYAGFGGATFNGDAGFNKATFNGVAGFGGATFNGRAEFDRATFKRKAEFDDTIFTEGSSLRLGKALGAVMSFRRARFKGPIDGVWAAWTVIFDEARFFEPVTIRLLCPDLSLLNVDLRLGGALLVRGQVDATATTFGARTTISDPGPEDWSDWLPEPHQREVGDEQGRHDRATLADHLLPTLRRPTSMRSLRRATVADLELSAIDLTVCHFAGAHGLDRTRIDSACTLPTTPTGTRFRRPLRFTRRDAIAEERIWREQHATWDKAPASAPNDPVVVTAEPAGPIEATAPVAPDRSADAAPPDAKLIAGVYRALRKGLEDSSNEPGAADFYYGEMEMRRLARRASSATGGRPSLAEHWLLTAYWMVSGYGLRAWRAFTAIAVLILAGSVVFATVGVKDPPGSTREVSLVDRPTGAVFYVDVDKPLFDWGDAFELAGRNTVALLRNPSNTPELTPIGIATDIALRLLVPVLLALALLAVRGRTKR